MNLDEYMLEKMEWAIKNEQSRDTGNFRCTRHRAHRLKTNKTKHITQKLVLKLLFDQCIMNKYIDEKIGILIFFNKLCNLFCEILRIGMI